jgi:hypothetical protein
MMRYLHRLNAAAVAAAGSSLQAPVAHARDDNIQEAHLVFLQRQAIIGSVEPDATTQDVATDNLSVHKALVRAPQACTQSCLLQTADACDGRQMPGRSST